jgi:ribosomal protein S9
MLSLLPRCSIFALKLFLLMTRSLAACLFLVICSLGSLGAASQDLNDVAAAKNVTQSKTGSLTGAGLGLTRPVAPPRDASAALPGKPQQLTSPDQVPQGLAKSDWSSIRAAHTAWEHSFQPVKGGAWQARNKGQQWSTQFDGRGFTAKPQGADWQWGLELRSYGFGKKQTAVGGQPAVKAEGQRLSYQWDSDVQEWFINDQRGLEHGFNVARRPQGATEKAALDMVLGTRGTLKASVAADAQTVYFRDGAGAPVVTYAGLKVWDADGKVLPSRFLAGPSGGIILRVDESSARYPITIDPIAQQAYLKASQVNISDNFGYSVAVSGDTVVVGAYLEDSSTTGINSTPNEGASAAGAAYVFVRSGTTWSQQAYLKASEVTASDNFGISVAVSGDTLVVGATGEDSSTTGINSTPNESAAGAGAAYVFVRSGTTWSQQAYLKASQVTVGDLFGYSVVVSGDTLVVGARDEDSSTTGINSMPDESASGAGAAYVFTRSGTTWSQQAYLKASEVTADDQFGYRVAVSGDTLVVGAQQEDSSTTGINSTPDESATNAGAAYVFVRSGTTWSQQAYLKASQVTASDYFGCSVGVSGDTVVVGAALEDSGSTGINSTPDETVNESGAAYVFVRSGTTWSQQAYLKQNTVGGDNFGIAVAVSGNTVVVGAQKEDSTTTGVNSTPNDSANNAGAAYVFTRSGTTWSQRAYLKASQSTAGDFFGSAVAVSGDTAVVGASSEDSNTTGIDSTADESASNAGAAYIFGGLGPPPTVESISPTSGPALGGTSVTITGTGFTGATDVTIGGSAATAVTVVNDTTITATTPSGSLGTASVEVTTTYGTNAANTLYTYANEAPVITSNGGGATAAINVAENTTAVTTVTATDGDSGQTKTFSISGGADSAKFSIVAATGVLTFATAPNYEVPTDGGLDNVYEVTVRIVDNGSPALDDTQALSVTVINVNEAPVITSNGGGAMAAINVAENTTAVTTVTATDGDSGQTKTFSISGGADSAKFSIVAATGVLTFATAPNYEVPTDGGLDNVYEVTVRIVDNGSPALDDTQALSVTVINVNEAPVITSNGGGATAAINVAENTTAVTTVTATDGDSGQTKTFSISGGADSAKFSIVAATGVLTFTTAPNYEVPADGDTDNVYEVTVRIVDNGSPALDDTQTLSVTVTDANEAPVITSNSGGASAAISVAENTTAVTTVTATDVDASQTKTYSISGGADSAMFSIVPATGVLTFASAPNYEVPADGDTDNVYEVTVSIVDNGSPVLDDTQALSVTVTDVDEAPSITSSGSASFAENATGTVYTAIGSDPESMALSYTLGGTDAGLFDINATSGAVTFKVSPDYEAAGDSGANNVYDITVTASDGGLSSTAQAVAITVTNVNEAPVITSNGGGAAASINVAENTTAVTTVTATDVDAGQTKTFSISGGADSAMFSIVAGTGVLTFTTAPNYEVPADGDTDNVYEVTVRIVDNGSPALDDTQTLSVTVTDANEAPVITSNSGGASAAISVAENTTAVTTVTATDVDAGQTKTFSISGGADSAMFSIVPATGVLTFASAPNYEVPADGDTDNVYEVTVRIVDNGSPVLDDTQALSVTVTDVDEAPSITSSGSASFAENATGTVYTAIGSDPESMALSYTLGGTDAGLFDINATSGAVTFKVSPDYEAAGDSGANNVYDITVTASDGGLSSTARAVAITVTNVNEAPTDIALTSSSVDENVAANTIVGTFSTTDQDAGNTFTYSLVAGAGDTDNVSFNISGSSLRISASPDFETKSSYSIRVRTTDQGSLSFEEAFTISITDVNETPVITSNGGGSSAAINVAENTTAVTTVTATDVDAGQTKTFSISGGADSAMFSIVPATGVLTFASAPNYEVPADGDTDNVYEVTVRIVDNGSPALDDTQTLSVTVTDANEAPVITSNSGGASAAISVAENTTAVTTVTATDVDASQTKTYSISGGADSAMFSIVPATGVLTFASAPNYEVPADGDTDNVYEVTVSIVDNGSPVLDDTQALSVTVTDVDEAPSITSSGSASFAENGTGTVYTAIGSDPESAALSYTLGGTDAGLFDINAASGAVTFKVSPDYEAAGDSGANNIYDITVTASDGGLSSAARAVAVTVTNVDEAPSITSGGSASFAENATGTVYTAIGSDPESMALSYTLGGTDAGLFDINAASGAVTFKVSPDFEAAGDSGANNVYDITVTASDGGLSSAARAVAITVTDVNDAPVITSNGGGAAASINVAENTTAVTTVVATDADVGQTVTYSITGGADSAKFSIVPGTGVLTFATAPNFEVPTDVGADNVYDLVVTATDDGSPTGTQTQSIAVTVTNVSPAPTLAAISKSGLEDTTVTFTAANFTSAFTDPESGPLTSITVVTLPATGLLKLSGINVTASQVITLANLGNLTYVPAANENGEKTFTATATDGSLTSAAATVTMTLTAVNDAPVITSNGGGASASTSVAENSTAVTTVVATDVDLPAQGITYSITGGADSAKFSIVPSTGVLTFATAPNFEVPTDVGANNVYDLIVTATDDGSPAGTKNQSIAVTVTNVNEAPVITSNGGGATAAISVAENTTAVTTVAATDVDASQTKTYSISGGADSARFSIVAGTGVLTFTTAPNYEVPTDVGLNNVYEVTVRIVDNGSPALDDTQALSVTVTDVNDLPVITSNGGGATASTSVAENSTAVTTVVATDADLPAQGITYSITGGADSAKFSIVPSTGVLTFTTAPDFETRLDVGANNVYDLIVTATDDGSPAGTKNQSIAVTVTNVNEAPVITSNGGGAAGSISVAENTTAVTTVAATDVDAGQTKTYSISGGADSARFSIVAGTGVLTFTTAPNYEVPTDVGLDNVYDVTVRIVDNGSPALDDTQALSVTVTDANDAPVITSNGGGATASTSVAENSTAVTTVVATDADLPTQSITYSITGGVDAARFAIGSSSGVLTFVSAPNFESKLDSGANNVYDLVVTATDNGTPAGTRTQSIAVTVTNVNEAPVITSNGGGGTATVGIAENTTAVTTVTATDVDVPSTLTYSISGGADSAKFSINSSSGVLAFIAAPDFDLIQDANADNVFEVTVRVLDNGTTPSAYDDTQAISVTVTNVNETPVITSNGGGATAVFNVVEGTSLATTVVSTDPDVGQVRTYSITGGQDADQFTIDANTGALSFNFTASQGLPKDIGGNNTYLVSVRVSDAGTPALTDSQDMTITVVDDPAFTPSIVIQNMHSDSTSMTRANLVADINPSGNSTSVTFQYSTSATFCQRCAYGGSIQHWERDQPEGSRGAYHRFDRD